MARSITVIPARQNSTSQENSSQNVRRIRMAAYCRVSTDQEEQLLSYENQGELLYEIHQRQSAVYVCRGLCR